MARVQIETTGKGRGKVYLDGVELHCITSAALHSRVGELDRLTVDFLLPDGSHADSTDTEVVVSTRVHESLIRLGWTPPTS